MRTPLHGSRAPFRLSSNVAYFHDWRYVNHGGYRWLGPDGEPVPLWTLDPAPPMRYVYRDIPLGIELEAKPATFTLAILLALLDQATCAVRIAVVVSEKVPVAVNC